ncbi:9481_t:CDS:2 [Ambispora gerdemannii]|uniref:9481_t:CDS:1 n=1 Tax=Ambispora gerdemannii TaxID=144530 RepID=A0A9N8W6E5_9GLOM|nr:9481_t:CDS:2 [Ambispora gerdemannii]
MGRPVSKIDHQTSESVNQQPRKGSIFKYTRKRSDAAKSVASSDIELSQHCDVANTNYFPPTYEDEILRFQLQHYLIRFAWESNFSSPVIERLTEGAKVLDVGLLEMATDYPASSFVGVDTSPMYPADIRPKNVKFQIENILDELSSPNDTYDFVRIQFLSTAFTTDQWVNTVIPELIRVCRPGGFIEFMESDNKLIDAGPSTEFIMESLIFLATKGIGNITPYLQTYLAQTTKLAGICYENKSIPIGRWGGKLGELGEQVMKQTFEVEKIPLSLFLKITHEEYGKITRSATREFSEYKALIPTCRIWAEKV